MVKPTFLLLLFVLFVAGAETDNVTNTIFSESSASNITEGESSLPWFDFRRLIGRWPCIAHFRIHSYLNFGRF